MATTMALVQVISFVLLLTACNDNNDDEPAIVEEKLENVVRSKYYAPEDFSQEIFSKDYLDNHAMKTLRPALDPLFDVQTGKQRSDMDNLFREEIGTAGEGQNHWQIERHTFRYHSLSARGEDIVLSGTVIFPNNTVEGLAHRVQSLTLISAGAGASLTGESKVPPSSLRVFFNSAIILPDYQGIGNTIGNEAYCFASSKALVRQLADCAVAACQVMRQRGVAMAKDGYTMNIGISQKAVIPVAFAKWYERSAPQWFRDLLRLKASFVNCGPLDYKSLFWYLSEHPDFNAMLTKGLVASLAAFTPDQIGGYQPEEFMSSLFHDTKVDILGRFISYYDALARYQYNIAGTEQNVPATPRLADILAPDMLTADGRLDAESPKTQAFMRVLTEQNDIDGWSPTMPIYFIHCPQDDAIPYESVHDYYYTLSQHGTNPNVHWGDISVPPVSNHLLSQIPGAVHFVSSMYINIKLYLVEDLEDLLEQWEH